MRQAFDVNTITDEPAEPVEGQIEKLVRFSGGSLGKKQAAEIIQDRQSTHGDFRTNARLSQKLKAVFRTYDGWEHLDDVEKEVLDMISLKISRVLSGQSLERQHWEDIEGYAHLALEECK